jgi:hypothetical protein
MEQANFGYTSFDQLMPFDQSQTFLQLMVGISTGVIECDDSSKQIEIITDLRRMRKFHSDLFKKTFDNILTKFLNNMVYKDEPEVAYNALLLVSEILEFYDFEGIDNWVQDLIQAALEYTVSPHQRLKEMATLSLFNAGQNMYFEEAFLVLFENSIEREDEVAANAAQTLKCLIINSDENPLAYQYDWVEIFSAIFESLNKTENRSNIDNLREIIFLLQQKLKENFELEVVNKINPEGQKILNSLLEAGTGSEFSH